MPRKKKKPEPPKSNRPSFHKGLEGFDIKVNTFGEMESTFDIDKLNEFLNKELKDKKREEKDSAEEE